MNNYIEDRLAGRKIWWCPGGHGFLAYCPQPTDPDGYNFCCQYYYLEKDRPSCCRFPFHTGLLFTFVPAALVFFLVLLFMTCWFCPVYRCWANPIREEEAEEEERADGQNRDQMAAANDQF